ncbi:colicin immunity domain-containing protein [Mycobacterium sp. 050128]|uniref:colicin immunity domain-containing protein n=1 Tax=Mycobacterium sp. 050128 TaxID=3096112 RepID=UPI002EDB4A3F
MSPDKATVQRMTEKYRDVIFRFANRKISVEEFEPTYLKLFKHDKDQVPGPEFNTLEKLFFAVDDYVADPGLRQHVRGLDEEQLRDCARDVYQMLYLSTDH